MITNLKTPKIEVSAQQMRELGQEEIKLVQADANNGENQADGSGFSNINSPYKSEQYVKYKNNYMNRFTTMNGPIRKHQAGTKLKSLRGQSVISNETTRKNYILTGRLYGDMYVSNPKVNEVTVNFHTKDARKIIGAMDKGHDDLVGLNQKNQNIILKMVTDVLFKGIDDWAREDIVITVSK